MNLPKQGNVEARDARDPAVAVTEAWPFTPAEHRAMLANTDPGEYDLRPLRTAPGKNPIPAVSHIWAA